MQFNETEICVIHVCKILYEVNIKTILSFYIMYKICIYCCNFNVNYIMTFYNIISNASLRKQ